MANFRALINGKDNKRFVLSFNSENNNWCWL